MLLLVRLAAIKRSEVALGEMVQVKVAEVGSELPAASVANTSNRWVTPRLSGPLEYGEAQGPKPFPSSWQLNVLPVSEAVKVKVALFAAETARGFCPSVVSGGIESTVQLAAAGVGSMFPTASVARTAKVCGPWL